jgi:large subunit ribosomal protein L19
MRRKRCLISCALRREIPLPISSSPSIYMGGTQMDILQQVGRDQIRTDFPEYRVGDTVKVHYKIKEGSKERIQVFQGIVIQKRGAGVSKSFTVRKVSSGVGVERIFPQNSPNIDKLEIVRHGQVRRAKLFYLRQAKGKAGRIKERRRFTA